MGPLCASDGSVWFALATGGVARYRDGRAEIMRASSGIRGLANSLVEGREGEVFAATDQGLFVYDPKRPPVPLPPSTDRWDEFQLTLFSRPIRDSEGNVWVMLADRPGEISRWDGHAWRHQPVPLDTSKNYGAMASNQGHLLLGEHEMVGTNVGPAGLTKYANFKRCTGGCNCPRGPAI